MGDPKAIQAGEESYQLVYSGCHGATGEGGRRSNLVSAAGDRKASDEELFSVLKNGISGSDLPPSPFEEENHMGATARGMMTNFEVQTLAGRQLQDYDARKPGMVFAEPTFHVALDDAYSVQIETAQLRVRRGEAIAGYKIGCVSAAVRRQLGTEHAVFGHLFASEIRTSPAALGADNFCCLAVEGELALTLDADIDDVAGLSEDPARFVGSVFPVIELHHYIFRGPSPSAAEIVANNALQAGIVVPEGRVTAGAADPLDIRVTISDRVEETATVDPLETVYELASRLAVFGIKPRAGEILLTGSPLPLYPVVQGDGIQVQCPGVAAVTATVT